MSSTPGHEPGTSDSAEPEDGDRPPAQGSGDQNIQQDDQRGHGGRPGWASRQPPPAQGWGRWAPPGGPQPGPQAPPPNVPPQGGPRWGTPPGGWGGPQDGSGWQPGARWGGSQPQAPKPGVIPLRPLGVGDIIDGAISTLRRHWKAVVGITLAVGACIQAANVVLQHHFVDDGSLEKLRDNPEPTMSDIMHAMSGSFAAAGSGVVVTMIGSIVATAMLTMVVSRAVLGRDVTAAEAWRDARPQLPRLLGLTLLIPVLLCGVLAVSALPGVLVALAGSADGGAALASLGLMGGCVVAVWLWILWALASPALMLEKQGIIPALKRSAKLVRGAWWRVLGVQLVALLLILLASSIIELPFMLVGSGVAGGGASGFMSTDDASSWTYLSIVAIGGVLAATVTLPISAGVSTLLYMDQRIRRESLDLELVKAARAK
jgi:hypothetical protein